MKQRRGQSTAEYAILFSVVIAALVGMQLYMKRGGQARLKIGIDEYTEVGSSVRSWLDNSAPPAGFVKFEHKHKQYEPYYTKSDMTTMSASITKNGTDLSKKEVVNTIDQALPETNVRKALSTQEQVAPSQAD